jgi:hypothetical protein
MRDPGKGLIRNSQEFLTHALMKIPRKSSTQNLLPAPNKSKIPPLVMTFKILTKMVF